MQEGGRLFPHRPRQKVAATGNRADTSDQTTRAAGGLFSSEGKCSLLARLASIVRKWVPFPLFGVSSTFL